MYKLWKKVTLDKLPEKEQSKAVFAIIKHLVVLVWIFIGLLTFQWVFFLGFITYTFTLKFINGRLLNTRYAVVSEVVFSFIDFCFILFIVINSYHLHIKLL